MNEQEKFLKDTQQQKEPLDLFDEPLDEKDKDTTTEGEDSDDAKAEDESVKNRRHRRLEQKLQAEREANIALTERLKVVAEAKKSGETEPAEYLKKVERIYGTDSPEALAATEILKEALRGLEQTATQKAIETVRQEQREALEAERRETAALDGIIEAIEDEYEIDLSSREAKSRRDAFLKRLERLSPKDKDGNITEWADPRAVYEDMQANLKRNQNTRAKDVSDRSMTATVATDGTKGQTDANWNFLKTLGW